MKKSIRLKLLAGIGFLILFFVGFSSLLNNNYLEEYYLTQKRNSLMDAAQKIDREYNSSLSEIDLELERLERNLGFHVLILDQSYRVKYATRTRGNPIWRPRQLWGKVRPNNDFLTAHNTFEITVDPLLDTRFLNLVYVLHNNEVLILSTPLTAIQESADIANKFFMFSGILTIALGSIIIFFFARQFTRPILELNDIAQRMSKLDFSKKYRVKSEDEIGELGKSINSLSDQLHKSISQLQEANQKLKEDIEKERRIDEMRKEFISSVSHELKTPVALIQGYAEGLKVNVVEDEKDKNYYCDVIIDEANKMNRLIKELLDLSQIESGYFSLEKDVFNLAVLIDKTMAKYEPIFKEKGIKPQVQKDHEMPVYADFTRTEQVLFNYLNNAINHIDENKLLQVKAEFRDKKVRISVFNSGKHIPEESLDKLFTSFYKVDKARTRAYGGTGLGLSIVKAIQELDNNAYGVANTDNGVVFWFELDRAVI